MFTLIVAALLGGLAIGVGELLGHYEHIQNQTSRKIMHLAHALFIASWPFFVSYQVIILAELGFLGIVMLARRHKKLEHIRNVDSQSYGDFFFPLGVIAVALLQPLPWVFMTALFTLGVADALAALMGQRIKSKAYKVFGRKKTIAGTAIVWLATFMVLLFMLSYHQISVTKAQLAASLIVIPTVTMIVENFSVLGADNLIIPLAVTLLLGLIGFF